MTQCNETRSCACCGKPNPLRQLDPWAGRLDAYCEDCAHMRCDAYPGEHAPAVALPGEQS